MSEGINQPPDDPGESKNQMQQADNTDILIDKAEDDEYKYYESASEEEMEEDQFHDVSKPHLDKDTNKVMEKQIREENNPHFVTVQDQNSSSLSKMITTSRLPTVNEDNTISWNIRSVRTLSAFERLKTLKNQYKISFISLQEPFVRADQVSFYMRHLDMQGSYANINNKIWLFWTNDFNCRTTFRKLLWEDLSSLSNTIQGPWSILGDFNVIAEVEEKTRGTPYRLDKSFDFINFIEECGMKDAGFVGNINTWCNNRDAPNTIWKRLDRVLYNSEWFDSFNGTYFINREEEFIKYLQFLNIWTEHPQFREIVKNVWDENHQGNPLWVLHQKLKRTSSHLSSWSKNTYGDIHMVEGNP
ncbi:hypothetical protein H5410_031108 [Solanum commersonii]|uniref:Uncharacterized protein n=1 Tax=Solanum commersonii TaxID=4109 RepID=A0A9J5YHG8_SOLCO|nr:hypothetical protein H5410_031108 [Solanum commersonii]